jgi:hypothetical protein
MSEAAIAAELAERAKARGLVIPPEDRAAVAAGAAWLRDCLERLRQAGLTR